MSLSGTDEDSASANLFTLEKFKYTDNRFLWCAISCSRKGRPDTNTEDFLTCCAVPFFFLDV